jgi:tetratricopeptide (TPR) repeat protein
MSQRFLYLVLWGLVALSIAPTCPAQQEKDSRQQARPKLQDKSKEAEPPEEDEAAKPTEYAFNPLQAEKELKVGEFYMKKGSYGAAVARFIEATKWNPTLAEAYLKLGEAAEKYKDVKTAKEAYTKYLALAPDAKNAAVVKKKLEKL